MDQAKLNRTRAPGICFIIRLFYMVGVRLWDFFFFFNLNLAHHQNKTLYLSKIDFEDKLSRYLKETLATKNILS